MKTCLQCEYFHAFNPPSHGECFRFPPTPYKDGTVDAPRIKANRLVCGEFKPLPDGETAQPITKANVPSHGKVIQKDAKRVVVPKPAQPQPSSYKPVMPEPAPTLAQGYQKMKEPST